MSRSVRRIYDAVPDDIGDLRTQRALPTDAVEMIDPFLLLNHHGPQVYGKRNRGLPFGPHPHRGFETVTFILEGSLTHRDSAGHESTIRAGGVQWMTAGSGAEHSELSPRDFLENGGPLEILQLWINLPARLKMTEPRYIGLQSGEIPTLDLADGGVRLELIAGMWLGKSAAMMTLTDVHLCVARLTAGGSALLPAPRGRNVFFYVVRGEVSVADETARSFQLVEVDDDADDVAIEAISDGVVIFGHAVPLREPVVARGPFVMNTQQEILDAARDYQAGKFR